MKKPRVIILRTAGTNCDQETAFAFKRVGASCEFVHINRLFSSHDKLDNYQILAIPGGFTYGDDIASGKILANEIKYKIAKDLRRFIKNGKLIIGICNGFQVLVKAGILPSISGAFEEIEATLSINDSGKFEARWVYLKSANPLCVWTRGIDEIIYLPVAHGEGKFIPKNRDVLNALGDNGQIVFQYCDEEGRDAGYPSNPNGSIDGIAGICDTTGRIFGLMPHPERHVHYTHHPRWTRIKNKGAPPGLDIFRNGVKLALKI